MPQDANIGFTWRAADICKTAAATNATAATVHTVTTGKTFYMTSANLTTIKDASSTSVAGTLRGTVGGTTLSIISLSGQTLTAQTLGVAQAFPCPIPFDSGTAITVENTTNVANVKTTASIHGFEL